MNQKVESIRQKLHSLTRRLLSSDWRRELINQLEVRPALRAIPYWIGAVVVGTLAVLYSGTFSAIIELAQNSATQMPVVYFLVAPVAMILSSWVVVRFAPGAEGKGTPVVAQLLSMDVQSSREQIDSRLNLGVASIVILSSFLCILGGGAIGREGPMIHIAACVFFYISQQFKVIWRYAEHRSWILAGGAAGIAAAFNTPLAGIVFALEELSQEHFQQFKTVVISAVIVAGMVAQYLSGKYLYLGFPKIESVSPSSMIPALIVGVLCGAGAGLFDRTLLWLKLSTEAFRTRQRFVFAGVVGILFAALAVFVDRHVIGGGIDVIQELLFGHNSIESFGILLLISRFFSTILAHLSGVAGGFLAPSLSMGGLIGSITARWISPENHNLLVLVGMSGFLSAVIGAPFTSLVIVMEMTDRHSAIFPLMLTALVSLGVSKAVGPKKIS